MSASGSREVAAALRVQDAVRSMNLPTEITSSMLSAFNHLLFEAVAELEDRSAYDHERTCVLAADAFIAFARAGLQPEQIRRFARSNLRFMGSRRKAAAVM